MNWPTLTNNSRNWKKVYARQVRHDEPWTCPHPFCVFACIGQAARVAHLREVHKFATRTDFRYREVRRAPQKPQEAFYDVTDQTDCTLLHARCACPVPSEADLLAAIGQAQRNVKWMYAPALEQTETLKTAIAERR